MCLDRALKGLEWVWMGLGRSHFLLIKYMQSTFAWVKSRCLLVKSENFSWFIMEVSVSS